MPATMRPMSLPMLVLMLMIWSCVLTATNARNVMRVLQLSDVHLNISKDLDDAASRQMPFAYMQDAPIKLFDAALAYAKHQVIDSPDIVLFTGDHVVHGSNSPAYMKQAVETNVMLLQQYFAPPQGQRVQASAILGNSDSNPDYYMEVTDPATQKNPQIALIAGAWNSSLSPSDFDAFNRRGYLQYKYNDKLTILTLNTVPYSVLHSPKDNASQAADPFGQFEWLEQTLQDLRRMGKFAFITGHIAPFVDSYKGEPQWKQLYLLKFKQIVGNYADVVKAQFFGHVHSIEFRVPVVTNIETAFPLVPLFVSGSISPLFGNNPSFMVWEIDADTYDVVDFTVYGTNISEADQTLDWKPLFSASGAFGVSDLSAASLGALYDRMATNTTLLEEYYWNMKARSFRLPPCTSSQCRAKILCTMKWWSTQNEYLACVGSAVVSFDTIHRAATRTRRLSSSQTVFAVAISTVGSLIALAIASVMVAILKGRGIIKMSQQRDKEFEDVFPLL